MNKRLQFSVSMCVYKNDNPEWFMLAIKSILNQTQIPNEIVIVIDGPITDELERVVDCYLLNPIFKVIRLEHNQGHAIARKTGLNNCTFDYVALMDADDISVPNRFETELLLLQQNQSIDIVGGDIAEFIDDETNIVSYRRVPTSDGDIKEYLKKRCPFNQMTVMFRKSAVEEAGNYKDIFWNEDYFLWIRMMQHGCIMANTGSILVHARVGKEMYKRRGGKEYFKSEAYLQKYMLKNHIINVWTYCNNLAKRFVMQVALPSQVRGFIFQHFARSKK